MCICFLLDFLLEKTLSKQSGVHGGVWRHGVLVEHAAVIKWCVNSRVRRQKKMGETGKAVLLYEQFGCARLSIMGLFRLYLG
jgi:hypothetical protein